MRRLPPHLALIAILVTAGDHCGCQTGAVNSIASSHVQANVPDPRELDGLIRRELVSYFNHRVHIDLKIDYELLRREPTQSGVAYPKYYVWVKGFDGNRMVLEGAVRIAAIDKARFEVTGFLSRQEVSAFPADVEGIFPPVLKDKILNRAGAAQP